MSSLGFSFGVDIPDDFSDGSGDSVGRLFCFVTVVSLDSCSIWAVTSVVKTGGGTITTDVGADAAASAAGSGVLGPCGVRIVFGILASGS